ncbi:MAG: hypothetical protein V1873_07045 [Verrucomicrobiota bacterium]
MLSAEATIGIGISAAAVVGASVATYTTVRGTKGPRERAFVVRSALWAWLVIAALFSLMYYLPSPYNYFLLIPYFIHLPIMTYRFASRQQLIREEEETGAGAEGQAEGGHLDASGI